MIKYIFSIVLILNSFVYSFETRTIGGSLLADTDKTKPWLLNFNSTCTASLISDRFALTAFHCFAISSLEELLHTGFVIHRESKKKSKIIGVHLPFKDKKQSTNADIAILELATPLASSSYAKIPSTRFIDKYYGKQDIALLLGYGSNDAGATPFKDATELLMSLSSRENCDTLKVHGETKSVFPEYRICTNTLADAKRRGKDIGMCAGDSGGPLVIKENGDYYQVGVVKGYANDGNSFDCGKNSGRYVNISYFSSWIKEVLDDKRKFSTYAMDTTNGITKTIEHLSLNKWSLLGTDDNTKVLKSDLPSEFSLQVYRDNKMINFDHNSKEEFIEIKRFEGFWVIVMKK